ncbi:crotonobetaine/carnitine-CoA ligase [Microbulbifer donghaiensis]|uniref:Crotonobetaine/carnitine-CoA ligase n=1 Tax=Microbulbifer donghaiensis TaxID=494016 RepID=A0A1M4WZT3_9GAMM|nr:AMP-binding protein [Microbulbifer donghaiensis]SHE86573.1 crotonobetaine/carnitine-CoA ligase [Microbulbifer donghaiensis]
MNEHQLTQMLRADEEIITKKLDFWAKEAGDRTFFYYGEDDVALTYAEFARRTDDIAGNLAAMGIEKGDHVSVFSTNSLLCTLMMFGIWKAGAVYCPINFSFSGRLLAYQVNDTAPKLVVTAPDLLPRVNEIAEELESSPAVAVYQALEGSHDYVAELPAVHPSLKAVTWSELTKAASRPDITVSFDDPANLVYTSGTTGPSKGVVQPYRWMAGYTYGMRVLMTSDDVIYNDLPLYHVGGAIANVCRAAWAGCEVAVWNRFSPNDFWNRIHGRKVTSAILLDVMLPWLTKAEPRDDDRQNTLNKVHMQPLPLNHAEFAQRFGIDFVHAGFGQTETGMGAFVILKELEEGQGTPADQYQGLSHSELEKVAEESGLLVMAGDKAIKKGLMGYPSPFVEVSVRNQDDEECRAGEPGQLAYRPRLPGLLLHSYLGKPEKTIEAFKNLWFHTGDAAVLDEDGMLYFVDRLGDRIRVRGENLSSFQVEDMLLQLSGVKICAVVGIPSDEGDEDDIAAYIVPSENEVLTEDAIHSYSNDNLPKFMRPRYIRIVDEVPQTPTNKIEKYKLRNMILQELGRA